MANQSYRSCLLWLVFIPNDIVYLLYLLNLMVFMERKHFSARQAMEITNEDCFTANEGVKSLRD